ncbi:flagellar hook-basal body protein [Fictibacillus iocasae]|uniref:Flagellar hook-basal body protein n=1 Tax=Fictibacillus iocasae TaxID=2715437 RepID=A0ABW2NPZ3_9BACL
MNKMIINSSVTMGQLQLHLDTIANNMANSNTTGFKSRQVQFSDLLFQQVKGLPYAENENSRITPAGTRFGSGARISSTATNTAAGTLQQTGRSLDFALLSPESYFQIQVAGTGGQSVTEYTRDGAFYLSPSPNNPAALVLVTSDGDKVLGTNGPITIPGNYKEITIGQNGRISVTLTNGTTVNAGQLAVSTITKPDLMLSVGHHLRLPDTIRAEQVMTDALGQEASVQQGALESSNVDIASEMSELVNAQRSYQFNARTISMADQMMGLINGIR